MVTGLFLGYFFGGHEGHVTVLAEGHRHPEVRVGVQLGAFGGQFGSKFGQQALQHGRGDGERTQRRPHTGDLYGMCFRHRNTYK